MEGKMIVKPSQNLRQFRRKKFDGVGLIRMTVNMVFKTVY